MSLAIQDEDSESISNPNMIQTLILNLNEENFEKTLQSIKSLYHDNEHVFFFTDLFIQIIDLVKIRNNMAKILSTFSCSFFKLFPIQKDQLNKLLECLIYIFPDNDTYF